MDIWYGTALLLLFCIGVTTTVPMHLPLVLLLLGFCMTAALLTRCMKWGCVGANLLLVTSQGLTGGGGQGGGHVA